MTVAMIVGGGRRYFDLKKTLQCRKNSHQVLHGEQKKTVEKQYNK